MPRITDFAEVQYFVPYGLDLPSEVEADLKPYIARHAVERTTGRSGRLYTIPRYLMTQWLAKYAECKPVATTGNYTERED